MSTSWEGGSKMWLVHPTPLDSIGVCGVAFLTTAAVLSSPDAHRIVCIANSASSCLSLFRYEVQLRNGWNFCTFRVLFCFFPRSSLSVLFFSHSTTTPRMMYKLSTPEVDPRLAKFVELIPDRPKNRRRIAKTLLQKHIAINVFLYPATNNGIRLPKKVEDIISALEMWFRGRIASLTTFMEHWVRAERVIEIAWIVYNWSLEGQTAPLSLPSPLTKEYSSSTDAVSNAACPQKEENCQEPAHVVVAPVTLEEDVGDVDPRFAGFIDHFPESGKVWKLVRRILRKHVAFDVFLQPGFNSVMQQPKKVEDIISLLRERYGGRSRGEALPPVLEHWNR
ncbi:hypothetical protein BJ508DRAFT_88769 [Ascobolus immersus RN42]|uniref:Uncharacterized protein n=1 Tax=Ascobolus immersus RN42 TaxID=1160509 RepID=A0A3N4IAE8_ASCIM|nr:hypothetical protein BJ508DRAFT_88769 [Ascobolus immersus RN42]